MAGFRTPQVRLTIRARQYHFVAYEATPGNPRRDEAPTPAMWYLMVAGRRCPVMAYQESQTEKEVERQLTRWVRSTVAAPAVTPESSRPADSVWEE